MAAAGDGPRSAPPQARFIRIHRSTIVTIARLKEIKLLPSGEQVAVLQSGIRCRVSRSGRERLGQVLGRVI
ncbi:MAG: LytTR family DNA-binding domain-containing protein [Gemmatimonadales bacterium]